MPAKRGPIPKRDSERRRGTKRKDAPGPADKVMVQAPPVEAPKPEDSWHPTARDWYLSLAQSGQGRFMEPSDWQAARVVAHGITEILEATRFSAHGFAAVWAAMGELLSTEGARRRVRMEVHRQTEVPEDVPVMEDYRKVLG